MLDADVADVLVVAARRRGRAARRSWPSTRATPGVRIERTATVDATRRLFTVAFDDVVVARRPDALRAGRARRGAARADPRRRRDRRRVRRDGRRRAGARTRRRLREGARSSSASRSARSRRSSTIAPTSRSPSRPAGPRCAPPREALDGDPQRWPTTAAVTSSYVGPACAEACALALARPRRHRVHVGARLAPVPEASEARRGAVRHAVVAPSAPGAHADRIREREGARAAMSTTDTGRGDVRAS